MEAAIQYCQRRERECESEGDGVVYYVDSRENHTLFGMLGCANLIGVKTRMGYHDASLLLSLLKVILTRSNFNYEEWINSGHNNLCRCTDVPEVVTCFSNPSRIRDREQKFYTVDDMVEVHVVSQNSGGGDGRNAVISLERPPTHVPDIIHHYLNELKIMESQIGGYRLYGAKFSFPNDTWFRRLCENNQIVVSTSLPLPKVRDLFFLLSLIFENYYEPLNLYPYYSISSSYQIIPYPYSDPYSDHSNNFNINTNSHPTHILNLNQNLFSYSITPNSIQHLDSTLDLHSIHLSLPNL